MIRRSPTLIQISDLDVQDIRDIVAQQRTDAALHRQALADAGHATENPSLTKVDMDMLERYKAAEAKQQEKNRRLGLEPGTPLFLINVSSYVSPTAGPSSSG
ncbi:hypothetical protein AX17_001401 [Amanita inopinata Kibby_2008]|nr:hypothetical protein AX17_001401 [Amanita inopinata Kibby_2008]